METKLLAPTLAECLARPRNDLAAVRMLAATAVLHAHAWIVTTKGLATKDFLHVFGFTLDFHGVHAFFILSGLLLTRSLMDRPDTLRFVIARLMRYVPGIFVAALFAALVVGPIVTRLSPHDYVSGTLASFVLAVTTLKDVNATLPGVFDGQPSPGILFVPLWTIHYELVFAVVLAGIGALGLLRLRPLVLAGFVGVMAVSAVWFWNGEEHLHLGTPHHLVRFSTTFGIGIALGMFADRIPVSNWILAAIAAIAIPLGFTNLAAPAGFVLMAYAILCIGFCGGPAAAWLARLGIWSYGFYVWGYLIEQTLFYAFPNWSAWGVFAGAFVLALAAGWFSWAFVEQPAIARTSALTAAIRRLFRPRRSVPVGRD